MMSDDVFRSLRNIADESLASWSSLEDDEINEVLGNFRIPARHRKCEPQPADEALFVTTWSPDGPCWS